MARPFSLLHMPPGKPGQWVRSDEQKRVNSGERQGVVTKLLRTWGCVRGWGMRRLPYSCASLGGSGNVLPRFVSKSVLSGASGVEGGRSTGSVAADFNGVALENAIGHLGRVPSLAHVARSFFLFPAKVAGRIAVENWPPRLVMRKTTLAATAAGALQGLFRHQTRVEGVRITLRPPRAAGAPINCRLLVSAWPPG